MAVVVALGLVACSSEDPGSGSPGERSQGAAAPDRSGRPGPPEPGAVGGTVEGGVMASCAYSYPSRLAQQAFALDGTVTASDGLDATVTVNRWFTGGTSTSFVLPVGDLSGETGTAEAARGFPVGTRLLISGQLGGPDRYLVWRCGYTRPWTEQDEATWQATFS